MREVLDYPLASVRVIRHVRLKLSCRSCEAIAQALVPSPPIQCDLPTPDLLAHVAVANSPVAVRCIASSKSAPAPVSSWTGPPWPIGLAKPRLSCVLWCMPWTLT